MKTVIAVCFGMGCGILGGCQTAPTESEKYAELRDRGSDSLQVLIVADQQEGVFTVHGLGRGNLTGLYYWVTLSGPGPTYADPKLYINSNTQFRHVGTITVDRGKRQVVIDLKRVVSKPGEPEKLELSPANGTYPIKKANQEPFMKPE